MLHHTASNWRPNVDSIAFKIDDIDLKNHFSFYSKDAQRIGDVICSFLPLVTIRTLCGRVPSYSLVLETVFLLGEVDMNILTDKIKVFI